jgi:hypothetical protein
MRRDEVLKLCFVPPRFRQVRTFTVPFAPDSLLDVNKMPRASSPDFDPSGLKFSYYLWGVDVLCLSLRKMNVLVAKGKNYRV